MRAPLLALAALTLTAPAWADPRVVTFSAPGVTFSVPPGFEALEARNPTADLLGTWRRDDGPLLLQFVHLGARVPQRRLDARELAELRGSDPYPFVDTRERARTLGFEVDSLAGRATVNGRAVLRLSTAVPLVDDSVMVVVLAPAAREAEARTVFRAVLASARGPTAWQTPRERARSVAQTVAAVAALALIGLYAVLALAVFRTRDRWHRARSVALLTIAALWVVVAALAPAGSAGAVARALVLAAAFGHHGWRMRRR